MEPESKRVCLLTGAGGVLGAAFCRTCAATYDIVAIYRTRPPGVASQYRSTVNPLHPHRRLAQNRHPVFEIRADLTREGEVDRVVDLALAHFGRIDFLVNAAGLALDAPFLDLNRFERAFQEQMKLNAIVPVRLAASVLTNFWRDRKRENLQFNRNVVNVSSTSGLYIYSRPQRGAYGASKAALNFLSCHLANEFARFGIRVNVIAPTSFPQLISTDSVVDGIIELDNQQLTGRVLMLHAKGRRLV
jgi:NAD(P)-dependent dehydrogenase (short-subunit alcohol dehydrogenase family)